MMAPTAMTGVAALRRTQTEMTAFVLELNSFHLELLPMYRALLPALFGAPPLLRYFVLPTLVERARDVVGDDVVRVNPSWVRYALPWKPLRARYHQWHIQRMIDAANPDAVVFNTVEPAAFFQVFRQISHPLKIGVVHNPKREGIDYQPRDKSELIFCLHDYNYHRLETDKPVDGYFSPFFKFRAVDTVPRAHGPLEIAVQGVISFNRRDYPMLVSLCEGLSARSVSRRIVFNILGDASLRDGPTLQRLVRDRGLDEWFRFHTKLSDKGFFDELGRAHWVMPLLNARRDSYVGAAKVTAALGHAGAYGIPLILPLDTAELWGIPAEACVAFDGPDDLAQRLAEGLADRDAAARRHRQLIESKIRANCSFLEQLSRTHPAFEHLDR